MEIKNEKIVKVADNPLTYVINSDDAVDITDVFCDRTYADHFAKKFVELQLAYPDVEFTYTGFVKRGQTQSYIAIAKPKPPTPIHYKYLVAYSYYISSGNHDQKFSSETIEVDHPINSEDIEQISMNIIKRYGISQVEALSFSLISPT